MGIGKPELDVPTCGHSTPLCPLQRAAAIVALADLFCLGFSLCLTINRTLPRFLWRHCICPPHYEACAEVEHTIAVLPAFSAPFHFVPNRSRSSRLRTTSVPTRSTPVLFLLPFPFHLIHPLPPPRMTAPLARQRRICRILHPGDRTAQQQPRRHQQHRSGTAAIQATERACCGHWGVDRGSSCGGEPGPGAVGGGVQRERARVSFGILRGSFICLLSYLSVCLSSGRL